MNASPIVRCMEDRRTLFVVLALLVVILFVGDLTDYDLWWHLKAGENIVRTASVPRADPFSYTALGKPWVYHSWVAGAILYGVHAAGGFTGLILLQAVLIGSSLLLSWRAARNRSVHAGLAAILVLAAAYQLRTRALTRPFLFSFVLFMAFYLVLQHAFGGARSQDNAPGRPARERQYLWGGGGRLLLLPFLTILWANLHAGFLVGLLAIGAYGAAEMVAIAAQKNRGLYATALLSGPEGARFRALLLAGLLCLAASLLTPYGAGSLLYTLNLFAQVKMVKYIAEWQPMPLAMDYAVFWALLAIAIVALARSVWLSCQRGELRQRVGQLCADVLLMGGFGLMAVRSVRNLEPFVLLAPPVLGYHLTLWRRPADGGRGSGDRTFRWAFYVLSVVLVLRHVSGPGFGLGVSEEKLPVRACNYLETAPLKGRLYNVYEWGGYLIWRFWPERKVFMDGRCDVYGDELIREAVAVARGDKGWEEILKRHSVEAVLIRWRSRDSRHFFRSGRWHCIYWDDTALIAVCDEVRNAGPSSQQYFDLSNPAVFDERIEGSAPEAVLAEVDRVLARQHDCSTALAFRARCLLRIARKDPGAGQRLLEEALRVAKQAVTLGKMTPDPWRAMSECYQALGRHDDARRALLRAQSLEKRPE